MQANRWDGEAWRWHHTASKWQEGGLNLVLECSYPNSSEAGCLACTHHAAFSASFTQPSWSWFLLYFAPQPLAYFFPNTSYKLFACILGSLWVESKFHESRDHFGLVYHSVVLGTLQKSSIPVCQCLLSRFHTDYRLCFPWSLHKQCKENLSVTLLWLLFSNKLTFYVSPEILWNYNSNKFERRHVSLDWQRWTHSLW